jgi:hypothetical protein
MFNNLPVAWQNWSSRHCWIQCVSSGKDGVDLNETMCCGKSLYNCFVYPFVQSMYFDVVVQNVLAFLKMGGWLAI